MRPAAAKRNRFGHFLAMALVVAVGLLWRSAWLALPELPRKYGGDALWALVVFLGFGFLFPRLPSRVLALLAMAFSTVIEFSQLYHAPWIDSIRQTRLGALVLGSVFNWPDFAAYAVGITLGALGEGLLSNRSLWCRVAANALGSFREFGSRFPGARRSRRFSSREEVGPNNAARSRTTSVEAG